MDPFQNIPSPLLLNIICLIPDLLSLHSIIKASPTVSRLFDECSVEITEAVMAASLPTQIQGIIHTIVLIRSSALACFTWDEFSQTYIVKNASSVPRALSKATLPSVLRGVLASACQIWCLTHCCLQHYIDRSMTLQPSRLVDPQYRYGSGDFRIRPRHRRPEGRRYQPQNSGPASWVEVQRVARALWWIQMFYDLKNAASQSRLDWSKEDVEVVRKMETSALCSSLTTEPEQIKTVLEYICDIEERKDSTITNEPAISSSISVAPHFRLPQQTQEIRFDWPRPEPVSESTSGPNWYQKALYLDQKAPGELFACALLSRDYNSPLRHVTFEPFRRLGFAIWDLQRMCGLGLLDPPPRPFVSAILGEGRIYFTWRSILRDEELAEVDRAAEEHEQALSVRTSIR